MSDPVATFADDLAALVSQVEGLLARASEIAELRAKQGRRLGKTSRERLGELAGSLEEVARTVGALAADEPEPEFKVALELELERFKRLGADTR